MSGSLFEDLTSGDTAALSRAITRIESSLPEDAAEARELVERCLPHSGNSLRIAISGTPGAGKSALIDEYGIRLVSSGARVAVLAVDPTSPISGGSILGDKTRMDRLASHPDAFVRPSPSRGTLGGVTKDTREAIVLCEAAGYDTILVETVGVGQSELAVHGMVDVFVLLGIAGAGDDLQGIKRGALELADIVVVTKADGDNESRTEKTRAMIRNTLSMLPQSRPGWKKRVIATSVVTGKGIDELQDAVATLANEVRSSGDFDENRQRQFTSWFEEEVMQLAADRIVAVPEYTAYVNQLAEKGGAPPTLAREFVDSLFDRFAK